MRKSRVTMKDVAAEAGVSLKTVSRVVNAEAGVAPETIETVRKTIDKLGYRTDYQAQALRRKDRRSRTIGLLVSSVANPFDSAIHAALEQVADAHSATVLALSSAENPQLAQDRATILIDRQIDGLIFSPAGTDQTPLATLIGSRPMVAIDREPNILVGDVVVSDNKIGSLRATRHLISQGHQKISFLADSETIQTARVRKTGFLAAMAEAKIEVEARLVKTGLCNEESARLAVHELMTSPNPPTAIFSAQNQLTAGALHALRELGADEQIAVVSFDDLPHADLFKIGLTAITQNPTEIGRIAGERLFGRLSGQISGPPETIIVPTGFKIRGSGEIKPPTG